ncbi:MFS transporter [Rhizorhapis suberifaciens]|uniref:Putative MFS family arabinose efflux permease n=1 Tax=Rhizorhapis suberifaciens TaxID=13656 RepID=A0A840HVA8_9SPHN|nr:MFS transporter [Rhizorhapis suberifaciens]MBB4641458.1 putative MFS family arabinose efflux permease [Rhizorhapis suberifaciens]
MKAGSWPSILVIYLFGVVAASAVTRIIPLGSDIMARFVIDNRQFGWLISLIAIPAVLLAIPSSLAVARFGPRAVLIGSAVMAAIANMLDLIADHFSILQISRLIEGIAVVHIYTAAPAFLMATVTGPRRTHALTLWATYAPVGTALGLGLGGLGAGSPGWRLPFALFCGIAAGVAMLGCLLPRVRSLPEGASATPTLGQQVRNLAAACTSPRLLALGLAALVVISLGFGANISLPDWLVRNHHIPPAEAAGILSLLTLLMLPGSFGAGTLMSGAGLSPPRLFLILAPLGFAAGALAFKPEMTLVTRYVAVGGWFLCSGAALAIVMAALPLAAQPAHHGAAAALVNQAGALATFINPPFWQSMLASGIWSPFALTLAIGWIISAGAMLFLTNRFAYDTQQG